MSSNSQDNPEHERQASLSSKVLTASPKPSIRRTVKPLMRRWPIKTNITVIT